MAVAGPLSHLPQLALWMAVEVGSFAAAGFGPRIIWRVWPPSNNVWLALVTFAVRTCFDLGEGGGVEERERKRGGEREREKERNKEKKLLTLSLFFFLVKKMKN